MLLSRSGSKKSTTGSTRDTSVKYLNRSLSTRSTKSNKGNNGSSSGKSHTFSFNSLRGNMQPELSKKLYKLIKSENHLIGNYEAAGKERVSIASQLSDWGEQTGDDAISDISDKVGVLLSELGEQEDLYAHNLDDSRGILKVIRNTEKSVQPSRNHKAKIQDEIAKLKVKEPESTKLITLEQELVRAEAENLVAEAQLTNVTRQKMKEAYAAEFAATIERAEKQIILARHGRRLLNLLDDSPLIPGDTRPTFQHYNQSRQILNDAEEDLRDWTPELEDVPSHADNLETNLMPRAPEQAPAVPAHNVPVTPIDSSNIEHSRNHSSNASVTTGPEYAQSVPGGYDTTGTIYTQSEAGQVA